MKKTLTTLFLALSAHFIFAQNVGIGIVNPQHKLHINGGDLFVQSSSGSIRYGYEGGNQWRMTTTGGGSHLQWSTSTDGGTTETYRHYFDQNGNIGFGGFSTVVVPTARLHIKGIGTTSATTNLLLENSAGDNLLQVLDNGNLGIGLGASSPSSRFEVKGISNPLAKFDGGAGMYIGLYEAGVYRGYIGSYSGDIDDVDFGSSAGSTHLTSSGGTPRLTVTNIGRVGIGTQSPGSKLAVTGLPVYADNTAATTGGLLIGDFYRTAAGVVMVRF